MSARAVGVVESGSGKRGMGRRSSARANAAQSSGAAPRREAGRRRASASTSGAGRGGQVIVRFHGRTCCVDCVDCVDVGDGAGGRRGGGVAVSAVLAAVGARMGVPARLLFLSASSLDRTALAADTVVAGGSWLECRLRDGGLRGGKGGFGAALRASARGKGAKTTTDFGACRDLNGRRLRHVNNEIRLRVWREEEELRKKMKESKEEWDPKTSKMLKTKTGIKNWFLDVPTWADGVKSSGGGGGSGGSGGAGFNGKAKTSLCRDWERVRASGDSVPEGAPRWWGCARGRRCPFAHGEDELDEKAHKGLREKKKQAKRRDEDNAMRSFVKQVQATEQGMGAAIVQGLKRSKQDAVLAKAKAKAKVKVRADGAGAAGVGAGAGAGATGEEAGDEAGEGGATEYLTCIAGDVGVGATGEVEGRGLFSTAVVPEVAVTSGCWYFEVEVLGKAGDEAEGGNVGDAGESTADALQIGCATEMFEPAQDSNDGVGDAQGSWSFDPARWKAFAQGEDIECEQQHERKEEQAQVVGVHIDVKRQRAVFSHNGLKAAEVAFTGASSSSSSSSSSSDTARSFFYPAISLEQGVAVRVNLGERKFQHLPLLDDAQGIAGDGALRERRRAAAKVADAAAAAAAAAQQLARQERAEQAAGKKRAKPGNAGKKEEEEEEEEVAPLELDDVKSCAELEALGMRALKVHLMTRDLKCGGTLRQRAERLFSVKGKKSDDIDPALRPKAKKQKQKR